jgi:hypothetical protein
MRVVTNRDDGNIYEPDLDIPTLAIMIGLPHCLTGKRTLHQRIVRAVIRQLEGMHQAKCTLVRLSPELLLQPFGAYGFNRHLFGFSSVIFGCRLETKRCPRQNGEDSAFLQHCFGLYG